MVHDGTVAKRDNGLTRAVVYGSKVRQQGLRCTKYYNNCISEVVVCIADTHRELDAAA